MANKKEEKTITTEELIESIRKECDNPTIEGELLRTKLIRELYKQLGDPKEEDFGGEMEPAGTYWSKENGYTTYIEIMTEDHMNACNKEATNWQIKYPSETKCAIVRRYEDKGWHCSVGPYVVSCTKFVKHPKHEGIWVCFRSTRDCNKYQYIIEK